MLFCNLGEQIRADRITNIRGYFRLIQSGNSRTHTAKQRHII